MFGMYIRAYVMQVSPLKGPCNRRTIERVNEYAPQHSRIFKEVRVFARPISRSALLITNP